MELLQFHISVVLVVFICGVMSAVAQHHVRIAGHHGSLSCERAISGTSYCARVVEEECCEMPVNPFTPILSVEYDWLPEASMGVLFSPTDEDPHCGERTGEGATSGGVKCLTAYFEVTGATWSRGAPQGLGGANLPKCKRSIKATYVEYNATTHALGQPGHNNQGS